MNSKREINSSEISSKNGTFKFLEFSFNEKEKILFRGEEKISMPPKTCELLAVLLENRGKLMTKDELFAEVWADVFVEEANLSHHIAVLRKALGENKESKFIETVPRRGYRFVAPVETSNGEFLEIVARERTTTHIVKEVEFNDEDDFAAEKSISAISQAKQVSTSKLEFSKNRGLIFGTLLVTLTAISTLGFVIYNSVSNRDSEKKNFQISAPEITRVSDKSISISVISPDGKFLANAQNSNVKSGGSLSIRQLDTNREIQLVAPDDGRTFADMKFSHDGSLIYFISYEKDAKLGAIYRVPFLGGIKQKIVELGEDSISFALSPDGKQIAFYRKETDGKSCSLIAAPLDNPAENEKVLFSFKFAENNLGEFLSWSPDGKYIGLTKVPNDSSPRYKILGFDLQTNEIKPFTEETFENIGKHVFSPDGREILFVGKRGNEPQNFFAVNVLNGSLRPLSIETPDATYYSNYGLSLTADGQTMTADLTDTRADIWKVAFSGGNPTGEAENIKRGTSAGKRGLTVLPDGKILYTTLANGKTDIWKINEDGSSNEPLTNDNFLERHLVATRDGRFIVYSSNAAGGWHLFRMNAEDGGDVKQLTFGDALDIQPDISPDGNWIVYISEENGKSIIKKIPFAGGESIVLNNRENSVYPKFSPDGNRIAFQILSTSRSQPGSIALIPANGGNTEKTFSVTEFQFRNDAAPIQWTPDGTGIIFTKVIVNIPNLWRLDLQTGKAAKIWTSFPEESLYNFAFSADNSRLFFSRGIFQTNTVLIKKFNGNVVNN